MKKLLLLAVAGIATVSALAGPAAASSSAPSPTPAIDWDRDFGLVAVENGLVVRSCEGDAPFVCITTDDGIPLGYVEHLSYPTDITSLSELKANVHDFLDAIVADRAAGCGPGYELVPGATPVRTVAGTKGVRYSFTGTNAAGKVVERTVGFMAVQDGHLHVLTAPAYDDGGCLGNEGELSVAFLEAFEPSFDQLVVASPLRNLS